MARICLRLTILRRSASSTKISRVGSPIPFETKRKTRKRIGTQAPECERDQCSGTGDDNGVYQALDENRTHKDFIVMIEVKRLRRKGVGDCRCYAKLTHWQQLKKSGNSAALASYEHEVLSRPPGKNQVKVAMEAPGRLLGTTWFLDADAFVQ